MKSKEYSRKCPALYVMEVIGAKWKIPILWALISEDGIHYNKLKRKVQGITNTMLTKCLRELENDKLIYRVSLGSVPPSVTYHLTEDGKEIMPTLNQLYE